MGKVKYLIKIKILIITTKIGTYCEGYLMSEYMYNMYIG